MVPKIQRIAWRSMWWVLGLVLLCNLFYSHAEDFRTIDWGEVKFPSFAAAVLFALVTQFGMILRWWWLLPQLPNEPTFATVLRIGFVGAFFNYSPTGAYGSMGVRGLWLNQVCRASKTAAIASVLGDRILGFISLLVMGAIASWFVQSLSVAKQEHLLTACNIVAGFAVALLLGSVILFHHFLRPRHCTKDNAWWHQLPVLGSASPCRTLAVAFGISCGSNMAAAASLFCTAGATGWVGSNYAETLLVLSWTEVVTAIAPTPGGIGIRESMLSLTFGFVENAAEKSAAVIAVGQLIVTLTAMVFGFLLSLVLLSHQSSRADFDTAS